VERLLIMKFLHFLMDRLHDGKRVAHR